MHAEDYGLTNLRLAPTAGIYPMQGSAVTSDVQSYFEVAIADLGHPYKGVLTASNR